MSLTELRSQLVVSLNEAVGRAQGTETLDGLHELLVKLCKSIKAQRNACGKAVENSERMALLPSARQILGELHTRANLQCPATSDFKSLNFFSWSRHSDMHLQVFAMGGRRDSGVISEPTVMVYYSSSWGEDNAVITSEDLYRWELCDLREFVKMGTQYIATP